MIALAKRIPYTEITPPQARAQFVELVRRTRKPGDWQVTSADLALPGPAGAMRARLFWPSGTSAAALPTLLYFHGGGWSIGDIDSYDPLCRQLAATAGCAVLSLDYRLAPEHPFPAAPEDCFAALRALVADGERLGLDTSRLALGGDSAGGNLAAVTAIRARDAGIAPAAQILFYPATDFAMDTGSHADYAEGFLLTRDAMNWFSRNYLGHADGSDWRASPLLAPDLARLPPAIVIVGECDPLCDEGRAYAQRLREAGNEAAFHLHPGMIHAFVTMGGIIDAADRAIAQAAEFLGRAFRR